MASSRDPQIVRSHSHHRLSLSSAPSHNVPIRHTVARHHSHSVSLGSVNPSHRVTRRKSMTSSAANNSAAIAAAINGADDNLIEAALQRSRQSISLKHGETRRAENTAFGQETISIDDAKPMANLVDHEDEPSAENDYAIEGSMIIDRHTNFENGGSSKARVRRASEGAHHSRREGKRASGEVRCEKCGKGYKHSSCLTKHLWEHTPEWTYTSKLLISKHQQVQLLEAATVLVGMNHDPSAPPDSAKTNDSDHSSSSPAASGSSELHDDDYSSAETTPPPISEQVHNPDGYSMGKPKRHSSTSSAFSRSYQSAPSSLLPGGQIPSMGISLGNSYQAVQQRRPSTSSAAAFNCAATDEEEASLVAAVESLCSFGTPRSGPVHLPLDVPPVPPLPARFIGQNNNRLSGNNTVSLLQPDFGMPPPPLSHRISDERDVKMDRNRHSNNTDDDEDYDIRSASHGRSDEDDDGVFGRMET